MCGSVEMEMKEGRAWHGMAHASGAVRCGTDGSTELWLR